MTGVSLTRVIQHLDETLRVRDIPDYAGALNGLQLHSPRPVTRVAAAVDASRLAIEGAIADGARVKYQRVKYQRVKYQCGPIPEGACPSTCPARHPRAGCRYTGC